MENFLSATPGKLFRLRTTHGDEESTCNTFENQIAIPVLIEVTKDLWHRHTRALECPQDLAFMLDSRISVGAIPIGFTMSATFLDYH
jgi:hypothetical protein